MTYRTTTQVKRWKSMLNDIGSKLSEKQNETFNSRVLIVDGLNTFIRVFSVIPVTNEDGDHIGGISGFLRSLGYAIRVVQPTRIIVVFDGKGGSVRRKKIFPEYKERRTPKLRLNRLNIFQDGKHEQAAMKHELVQIVKYLSALPVLMLSLDNVEADDVISYITKVLPEDSRKIIMSTDKDFYQLVSDNVEIWSPTKKKFYTKKTVNDEFGVWPHNITLFRSLLGKGDQSDNIHGVKGLGQKTILKKFPILKTRWEITPTQINEECEKHISEDKKPDAIYQKVLDNSDIVNRNMKLMVLSESMISGNAREIIQRRIYEPVSAINRFELYKLFSADKLENGIKDFDYWIRENFVKLERFALLSQKRDKVDG